ncbi:VOC family protein [Bacillus sp. FSL W7-1360]
MYKLDHVAYAVPALASYIPWFEEIFRVRASKIEVLREHNVNIVFLEAGLFKIELIEPLPRNQSLNLFLKEKGPGFHHVAFSVRKLHEVYLSLRQAGCRFTSDTLLKGSCNRNVIFIHPHVAQGLLIELCEES